MSRLRGLRAPTLHSEVLLVIGALYAALGALYVFAEPSPTRLQALQFALSIVPSLPFWGVLFTAAGVAAAVSGRWPPASERWGYFALTVINAWWSFVYAVGVILGSPVQGLTLTVIFAALAYLWIRIPAFVNPPQRGGKSSLSEILGE